MERGSSTSLPDRSRRRNHCVDSVDGICDLPDSILGHILSFLPTKDAVATSILSQRWKFLWTTTSNLDFYCWFGEVDRFVEFVNYVLLLHKHGYLNRFSLIWYPRCIPFCVNDWITAAISRNVVELFLRLELSKLSIHVQRSIFSCESLRSLQLYLDGAICISNEIVFSLPKLESLQLFSVFFESEETLCKLLGGCPVLKYLFIRIDVKKTIENCHLDNGTAFRCIISSTSLRHLELFADDEVRRYSCDCSICGVQLNAPSLNYIKLQQISSISIQQRLIFLVEAIVQLFRPDYEDQNHYNSVVEAFRAFDCAKTLALTPQVITAFSSAPIQMKTMFDKLTRLEVTKDWIDWSSLHKFIMLTDNLEVFIVKKDYETGDGEEPHLTPLEPDLVPGCMSNSLRLVSIGDYDGNEDDFAMVSYILKHGSVLQLMEISLRVYSLETKCEVIQNISKLPRKSSVCEVEFCGGWKSKIEGMFET